MILFIQLNSTTSVVLLTLTSLGRLAECESNQKLTCPHNWTFNHVSHETSQAAQCFNITFCCSASQVPIQRLRFPSAKKIVRPVSEQREAMTSAGGLKVMSWPNCCEWLKTYPGNAQLFLSSQKVSAYQEATIFLPRVVKAPG